MTMYFVHNVSKLEFLPCLPITLLVFDSSVELLDWPKFLKKTTVNSLYLEVEVMKYFETSVLRHIRFAELRKIQIEQPNFTN